MQVNKVKVLFKTKGGHKEGMGDITSSLALAEAFRDQGHEAMFIVNDNKSAIELISQKGFKYKMAETQTELATSVGKEPIDIAILNQLNTPTDETQIFKANSKMLVTIDDTGDSAELADISFNVLYPIESAYVDFKYIALFPVFQEKHNISRVIKKEVETILVTQGGSDTYGYTPKIIKGLYKVTPGIVINVVLGPNFSHHLHLKQILEDAPRSFNIIKGKNDLSNLMLQADMAISGGGNILFELACLGVPTIVICGERFEEKTAKRLQGEGFGINLGFGKYVKEKDICGAVTELMNDTKKRRQMSAKGMDLIDGYGATRVAELIIRQLL
ncbi:MAG: hypothetical protein JSV93_05375 [Candidatus Omnitrophota bacterium]|nr:MAG: hypothetical protein JSV93_05375 [Candidatus Omnitrophota bacterium]